MAWKEIRHCTVCSGGRECGEASKSGERRKRAVQILGWLFLGSCGVKATGGSDEIGTGLGMVPRQAPTYSLPAQQNDLVFIPAWKISATATLPTLE